MEKILQKDHQAQNPDSLTCHSCKGLYLWKMQKYFVVKDVNCVNVSNVQTCHLMDKLSILEEEEAAMPWYCKPLKLPGKAAVRNVQQNLIKGLRCLKQFNEEHRKIRFGDIS